MMWLFTFIDILFKALYLAILIRVILSWVSVNPYHPLVSLIYQITDPIIEPLRRIIPPIGMIDVTPLVAMLLLSLAERVVYMILGQILL